MAVASNKLRRAVQVAGWLALVEIVVAIVCLVIPVLKQLGIHPRTVPGLAGVVFSPLLHANMSHLAANLLPLFFLTLLLFADPKYQPVLTFVLVWLVSGLGTWLIGRGDAVHLGASSIIYGLVAYLVVAGFRMGNWRAILVAVLICLLYGGLIYGVIPRSGPISWEGHLCGAVAGIWSATRLHK